MRTCLASSSEREIALVHAASLADEDGSVQGDISTTFLKLCQMQGV